MTYFEQHVENARSHGKLFFTPASSFIKRSFASAGQNKRCGAE